MYLVLHTVLHFKLNNPTPTPLKMNDRQESSAFKKVADPEEPPMPAELAS